MAVLLRLTDARVVGGSRFVFAPEPGEYVAQPRICVALVFWVACDVALQDRRFVLVAPGLLVFVGQGLEAGRVVWIIRQHPLEVVNPVFHLVSSRQLSGRLV